MIKRITMRWTGHVARMDESRGIYRFWVVKLGRNRQLERAKRKWEDNIKMDLKEFGMGDMILIDLAEDRHRWRAVVNAVVNLRVS